MENSNKKSRKIGQGNKLCRDIVGEVHEEECRDIPKFFATLIKQMAAELRRDISNLTRQEKGKIMKQCACHKVFYVATDISTKDKTKENFMSQHKKTISRHNIQSQQ